MATKKTVSAAKAAKKTAAVKAAEPKTFKTFGDVLKSKSKVGLPYGTKVWFDGDGEFEVKDKSGHVMFTGDVDQFAASQFKKLGFVVA